MPRAEPVTLAPAKTAHPLTHSEKLMALADELMASEIPTAVSAVMML